MRKSYCLSEILRLALTLLCLLGGSLSARAQGVPTQIVRDGTVGPDASVQPTLQPTSSLPLELQGPDFDVLIDEQLGERRGSALLHSFETFTLGEGVRARFTTDPSLPLLDVIISRVTGGVPSDIFGIISVPEDRSVLDQFGQMVAGGPDFFLINPAGIVFGPSSSVNVAGSFLGSTASELEFSDGAKLFVNPASELPAILSVPDVVRFGFDGSGSIAGLGTEFNASSLSADDVSLAASPTGSLTLSGTTISAESDVLLSGGSIELARNSFVAFGMFDDIDGNIRIVGTRDVSIVGEVSFNGFDLMSNTRLSSFDGGAIEITSGTEIRILGSLIATNAFGLSVSNRFGGDISLTAPRISIDGSTLTARAAAPDMLGQTALGGRILLRGGDISIRGGSLLTTSADEGGIAGDVSLDATGSILLDGSILSSTAALDAPAGTLRLAAPRIRLTNGAQVTSSTRNRPDPVVRFDPDTGEPLPPETIVATGPAGSLVIAGGEVLLESGSSLTSSSEGTGPAGSVQIGPGTQTLTLSGGSRIATDAAVGPAPGQPADGNIFIGVDGTVQLSGGSTISASVANGQGGDVTIAAPETVVLRDGSRISATTDQGTGGRISIETGAFIADPSSRVSADAGVGSSGSVEIRSPDVDLQRGISGLPAQFLNASALLRQSCEARAESGETGTFYVSRQPGLPASPEELLLALDGLEIPVPDADETPAVDAAAGPLSEALVAESEGARALQLGDFATSELRLRGAARQFDAAARPAASARALLRLGQAQQAQGRYAESLPVLESALARAEQSGDRVAVASVLGALGNAQVALGLDDAAEAVLTRGADLARGAGAEQLASALENDLANHFAVDGSSERARELWSQAAERDAQRPASSAKALANAARAAVDAGDAAAGALLARGERLVDALPKGRGRAYLGIHLGVSYARYAAASDAGEARAQRLLRAHALLSAAADQARAVDDPRTLSYALGNLGALYESERRLDEALSLTRAALREADRTAAPEASYRWNWQEGRLLWARGKASAALDSYRRAIQILEETRQETRARYGPRAGYFRRALAPVYLDMADALLRGADLVPSGPPRERLLVEARATVEQLKAAELRNYLRDDCAVQLESRTARIDDLTASAAVVYPIVFPDRLELLVRLPSGLERHVVPVPGRDVEASARELRRALQDRTSTAYRREARRLYDWLVQPYVARLEAQQVQTLAFVPDGALSAIPMAALWNGERFLAERFALATAPGLTLLDPRPLDREHAKLLLGGLSEPVQGFAGLASVPSELAAIQALFGGEVLLDGGFSSERLASEVKSSRPTLVHLASHAVFTGDPSTSFVLTHDGRLTMDRLGDLLSRTRLREDPIELLVLSACDTAVSDDRAGLGLAGVAVSSGARSALGSLWPIADEATSRLLVDFYTELRQPGVSRAQALQRAQQKRIAADEFSHPYFWSAFLLVSNWL